MPGTRYRMRRRPAPAPGVRPPRPVRFALALMLASALAVAALLPRLQAVRFALRGILLARGATKAITMTTVLTLFLLSLAFGFELYPARRNGALNTAIWWVGTLGVECAALARYALFPRPVPEGLPAPVRTPRESTAG